MIKSSEVIDKLFAVGAHFGYGPSRRHPSQTPFIFGAKGGTELFDLQKTADCLSRALEVVASLARERKVILFVGGKAEARGALERAAESLGQPYVASRWIGGSLTNFPEIRKRLNLLADLVSKRERGELAKFTKKERLLIDREIKDLETSFGGIKTMQKAPDAVFVVDPKREKNAIEEAKKLNIPIIAIMNSDCDRNSVTYPIPCNDASGQTIRFVLEEVTKTYISNLGPEKAPVAEGSVN